MASETPASMTLEECSQLISSPETFQTSVIQDPARWQHTIGLLIREASRCTRILQENSDLQARVQVLESSDEQAATLPNQLRQKEGALQMSENRVRDLTDRLLSFSQTSLQSVPRITKSPNHPDPEKFNGDKTKWEAFRAQINIKLKRNQDHYVREGQDTTQNELSYIISRLDGAAWAQVEPYVSADKIDFESVEQLMDFLEIRFGEVDPTGTAKHELYRLYQTNKDLEVFLNTFLRLQKRAKVDESQALDMLSEKLSDEFKDRLVTVKKPSSLNELITTLRDIDANVKRISKQSHLRAKWANPVTSATKPPFKTANSTPVKPTTSVTVTAPALSTATGTHPGPMDVSTAVRKGPISQEEKDRRNRLGLCRYCGEPGHIAIDHKDPTLLASKRQAAGITNNSMALVPYTPPPATERESSPS